MKKLFILSTLFIFSLSSEAKIYFDLEEDPLPVVDITVVIPFGHQTDDPSEAGLSLTLQEILSLGTAEMDKQKFNDELAKFGAEYSFSVGNHYSYWTLKFPFIEGKDYKGLIAILKENWETPRFTEKDFKLASLKIEASFKSSLDSDSGLLTSAMKRYQNKYYLGGHPAFLDVIQKNASLKKTQEFFNKRIRSVENAWVGAVAPESTKDLMREIIGSVFSRQGSIHGSRLKEALTPGAQAKNNIKPEKTFLVIDREDRAQTIMGFVALSPEGLSTGNELEFFFGDYLLFSNGLDSYFASVIRGEKGLAYGAYGLMTQYRDHKVLSLVTNPQASKMDEAFSTLSYLINVSLVKNENLKVISNNRWDRNFQSYKNLKTLENGLPDQRLSNRMGVVTGSQSYKMAVSDPSDWKVSRESVSRLLENHWKNSSVVAGAVGSAKKINPLLKKYFPNYKIKVIPYRDAIYSKAF